MSFDFEELDYRPTPIGALSLRRRRELKLGVEATARLLAQRGAAAPARHIAIDCGPKDHGLTDLEFMRGHRTPPRLAVPPRVRLYASSHSILDRKEIM
jgi:hypothetical protein